MNIDDIRSQLPNICKLLGRNDEGAQSFIDVFIELAYEAGIKEGGRRLGQVDTDSWEQLRDDIEEHIYMNIDIYDEHGEDREKGDRCAEACLIADGFIARAKALAKGD